MTSWTLGDIARSLGLQEAVPACQERAGTVLTDISTDTRTLAAGSCFVPLVGENFDGHDFLEKAVTAGCAAVVWGRPELPQTDLGDVVLLPVDDTLQAYQDLGLYHKKRCGVRCVGITGSVGKTTTKEILFHLLQGDLRVHKNRKNYNNDIGVPLTLLELTPRHDVVVVEMGMRGLGQIARLARCAEPEVGIITAIGTSHIELLGSRDNIAQAKAELFEGLPPGGCAVSPATDDFADLLRGRALCPVKTFSATPGQGEFAPQEILRSSSQGTVFRFREREVQLPLPGQHHLHDLMAALAAGEALGLDVFGLLDRVGSLTNPEGRSQWLDLHGARVYLDAYNSAPESLRAALAVLASCDGRKLAVLGDMLELGEEGVKAHTRVGEDLPQFGVEAVYAVGPLSRHTVEAARRLGLEARWFESKDRLAQCLLKEMRPGDAILVKASRGLALETVVETLKEKETV